MVGVVGVPDAGGAVRRRSDHGKVVESEPWDDGYAADSAGVAAEGGEGRELVVRLVGVPDAGGVVTTRR